MRDVTLPIAADLFDTMFGPIITSEIQATYAAEWKSRPGRLLQGVRRDLRRTGAHA